jgi:hypothetical protein
MEHQIKLQADESSMDVIPFGNASMTIREGRIPNVSLKNNEPSGWFKYFSVTSTAKTGDNHIGNIFIPTGGAKTTVELKESKGNQHIICQVNGKEVDYEISGNDLKRSTR